MLIFITSAEYEIIHFCRGPVAKGEDVPPDGLDTGSLLDVTRYLRIELFRQIMTQIYLESPRREIINKKNCVKLLIMIICAISTRGSLRIYATVTCAIYMVAKISHKDSEMTLYKPYGN